MSIALQVALVMVTILVILLIIGAPIGVAIGLSSAVSMICMIPADVSLQHQPREFLPVQIHFHL